MLRIGRNTDYAARVVLHLACLEEGTLVPIAEIAAKRLLPKPYTRRVVGELAQAGLVETVRGAGGGIRLAKPAAEISMLDVVSALEGGIVLNRCVDDPKACPLSVTCPVQRSWTDATRMLEAHLAGVRFDQLADGRQVALTRLGHPETKGA